MVAPLGLGVLGDPAFYKHIAPLGLKSSPSPFLTLPLSPLPAPPSIGLGDPTPTLLYHLWEGHLAPMSPRL